MLDDPTDPEQMYLDPNAPVPAARPIMTGDIFTDVPCSRGGAAETVMVMTHPCSMRKGLVLRETVTVATIVESPQPTYSANRWTRGQFDFMPLNDLPSSGARSAVSLTDLHSARTADLLLSRRIQGLSDYGVTVLLQRWIFQMSRDPVSRVELFGLIAPVLAEAEIQEQWTEVALTGTSAGASEQEIIDEAGARVQDILGPPGGDGLRDRLADPTSRASVRRSIAEIRVQELGS